MKFEDIKVGMTLKHISTSQFCDVVKIGSLGWPVVYPTYRRPDTLEGYANSIRPQDAILFEECKGYGNEAK